MPNPFFSNINLIDCNNTDNCVLEMLYSTNAKKKPQQYLQYKNYAKALDFSFP